MDHTTKIESSPSLTSRGSPYSSTPTHNPYQRMASRRAIACVTCAKAKTKCDKRLPSCSRCITKGIKCEPRSTRRTSDNSYRANIRKPFVTPKRYHSTSNIPTLNQHTSPRRPSSSIRNQPTRTGSLIDYRSTIKMSQQGSACSGFPTLTPLPTYTSSTIDSYYSYPVFPDHQNLSEYAPVMEPDNFHVSGRLTPQTPEPLAYHEPLSVAETPDQWASSQPWSDHSFGSAGIGFEADMTTLLPTELWSTPDHAHVAPIPQISWHQSSLTASPQTFPHELVSHAGAAPSLSTSERTVENLNGSGGFHEIWADYEAITSQLEMTGMVTQASFMHGLGSNPSTAPIWEDVFMQGSAPY